MLKASEKVALDIKMMLPSCVPATPFEHSGAKIDAKHMKKPLRKGNLYGVGEFTMEEIQSKVAPLNAQKKKLETALKKESFFCRVLCGSRDVCPEEDKAPEEE